MGYKLYQGYFISWKINCGCRTREKKRMQAIEIAFSIKTKTPKKILSQNIGKGGILSGEDWKRHLSKGRLKGLIIIRLKESSKQQQQYILFYNFLQAVS